jgi:uncharacterized protein YgiM (DUF1202 family)
MLLSRTVARVVCVFLVGLFTVLGGAAAAREMVSIKGKVTNLRTAPSARAEVAWELQRGYPLEVLRRKGDWLQVRDFENDRGWIARSAAAKTPHHVVKAKVANLRSAPSERSRVVGKAPHLEVLRTLQKKGSWVKVQRSNGQTAWVSSSLLWGW